jgi:hypothetical protein
MKELFDSFWRAVAYCMHPRVILLSLLPLLIAAGLVFALGYFFWEPAVDAVRSTLESWSLLQALMHWLDSVGAAGLHALLAPIIVVALTVPAVVVLSLLLVALLMTPALTRMVAQRRFPLLERKQGGGLAASILWSLACSMAALVVLVLSIPLWFVPPLVLIIPPLIWGWLTCKVMSFDVLAEHASRDERRALLREQRWPLLAMGVLAGYLGAAPSLLWALASGMMPLAPLLLPVSVWLYTLVFAFSSLWFAHFALAALHRLRQAALPPDAPATQVVPEPLQP